MHLLLNIDVDDLNQATRFYTSAFGLKVGRRFALGIELLGGPVPIYLLAKSAGTPAADTTQQLRTYDRHWTPVHLDFVTDDIDTAVARAVAAGALVEKAVATYQWGKLAVLSDPFGHGLCFVQFLGRGYDEIAE